MRAEATDEFAPIGPSSAPNATDPGRTHATTRLERRRELQLEGADSPRAYVLPWSQEAAEQLQQAMREAEEQGTGVQMESPFETDRQPTEMVFHAAPQPAVPQKPASADGPLVYVQPADQP